MEHVQSCHREGSDPIVYTRDSARIPVLKLRTSYVPATWVVVHR